MTVVLVTVAGPSGRRDLVVPADVPVGDLLGPIAAAAGEGSPGAVGQARWRLALPGGDALPPDRSLAAGGIGDGATLTLTLDPAPPPRAAAPPPAFRGGVAWSGSRGGVAPPALRASRAAAPLPAFRGAASSASRGGVAPPALRASREGATPPGHLGGAASRASRRGAARAGWLVGRGPRSGDQEDGLLEAAIAAPRLGRCVVVGVVSATAGVGGATVAALLAAVLAASRQGLTVAVDVRPGAGSLGDRLAPDLDVPAGDLLGLLDQPALTTGELAACLAWRSSRPVLVVGQGRALPPLLQGLARHAGALVLDCGPGLGGPGTRAAVAAADQLVLVTEPSPSPESRRVAGALADLGHAVVVAAGPGPGPGGPGPTGPGWRNTGPSVMARLLPGVRGVVPLPHPALAVPPREWAEVPPWWRRPARQLAGLLAADWPALGMTAADG
jgi:WXG100 protein secretion system (Wss), protein YukD